MLDHIVSLLTNSSGFGLAPAYELGFCVFVGAQWQIDRRDVDAGGGGQDGVGGGLVLMLMSPL